MAAAVARTSDWISLEQVRELSRALGENESSLHRRAEAYDRFLKLPIEPNPLYRGYGYFTNVDLAGLDAVAHGPAVGVPPPLPGTVRLVHDAAGTHGSLPAELANAGVRLTVVSERGGGTVTGAETLESEETSDRLSSLAAAVRNRGYHLEIPDGLRSPVRVQDLTILSRPHQVLSVRRSVRAGANSQLLLTEEVYSTAEPAGGQRLHASDTELDLGAEAKAVCLTVHAPDLQAVSVYQRAATTGPASRVAWLWAGLGGFRSKARNRTRLVGQGSVVDDLQLFYGRGEQSYDSSVQLTHLGTDTHGQSITRGVFTDQARGMSRGLVRIEKEARKTLSFISEHAMLLSRGARSDTIPILEILCRDVKATHSTSVHPVDPEQVFYLESRGIAEPDAVRMIGEGFLSYVLDRAPITSLRDLLYPALEARWNGQELPWTPDGARALPQLHVTGTEASPEWRFDTKLR
jgi:Fe-S cluster assembly scaffold protein SufB